MVCITNTTSKAVIANVFNEDDNRDAYEASKLRVAASVRDLVNWQPQGPT
jgi:hypothetical protein